MLRSALGIPALLQGGVYLMDSGESPAGGPMAMGVVALAAGLALVLGFFAPVASGAAALGIVGMQFGWLPAASVNLFSSGLTALLALALAIAIVPLGPGAFSLDGWRFGRRVIVIPPRSREREE